MSKRSIFKIFDDFTSNQLSKLTDILDPRQKQHPSNANNEEQSASQHAYRKSPIHNGIVAGLDIGSSKISVVAGKLNPQGQIEVLGFAEVTCDGLIRGAISNINKISAAITLALSKVAEQANIQIQYAYASYSGPVHNHVEHGLLLRKDIAAEIDQGDIEKLRQEMYNSLLPPGERLIYMQAKPYTIDSEPGIIDPVGMAGQRIETDYQLVTANTTPIDHLYKCCAQANVKLLEVLPSSIASAEAVLCEEEIEEGVAIIDIGAAVTSIAVYSKGNLKHVENFPLGGNNISLDIRDFTGLQLRQAELLKKQFGTVKPENIPINEIIEVKILNGTKVKQVSRKELCQVIKSRTEELISIAYSIIMEAVKTEHLAFGLVFTGGVSGLPHFKELAHELTRTSCHLGNTTLHLADQKPSANSSRVLLEQPSYATAVGLLKLGLRG